MAQRTTFVSHFNALLGDLWCSPVHSAVSCGFQT